MSEQDWGTTMPIQGMPKKLTIEDVDLYAGQFIHIGDGFILRGWHDESETIHVLLHMAADGPERTIFMFSQNGDVPVEIGQALAEAFMPDSLTMGIQVTSKQPGIPSGIMGSNMLGPIEGRRIILN